MMSTTNKERQAIADSLNAQTKTMNAHTETLRVHTDALRRLLERDD